jgi:hypothetical protein
MCAYEAAPRRDERYAVKGQVPISVTVQFDDNGETKSIDATAVDLSLRGTKLELPCSVPASGEVLLTIRPADLDIEITTTAKVCWARPIGDRSWWVGCAIDQALPASSLTTLAKHGYIDRRQDERRTINSPAVARWELGGEGQDIRLLDVSQGGLAILSSQEARPGDRLLLTIDPDNLREQPIIVRVQWQRPGGDAWVIGCSFSSKEGYPELRRRLLKRACQEASRVPASGGRRMVGYLMATAAAAIGALLVALR